MIVWGSGDPECACCGRAGAGHGHFALYCEPCSLEGYHNCTHGAVS